VIGLLGYWVIGLLGYWVIGLLSYWVLGFFIMGNEFEDYLLADGTVGKLGKSSWLSDRMF
ncbi:MAG TPA: hypothetical protein PLN13_09075, partial [Bacteroidia bacterium]|nr:hypothetical protein [Bacteroidia bacterium]